MIKLVTGQSHLFEWIAPAPLTSAPTFKVYRNGTASSLTMTQTRANASVSSISNDRRTLTVDAQATGLQADQSKAYLITNGDMVYPVSVARMVENTAVLADPLPREVDTSSAATLVFAMYYASVPTAVTDEAGYYPWQIEYVSDLGQGVARKVEKGLLKVTPRPFDTSLDHDGLVDMFPQLADMVPRRQTSYAPQVNAALEEIALHIRDHLRDEELTEDEVFNAQSFRNAHAYCTAARVYEMAGQLDTANAMRERCDELMQIALRSVAIDRDGDNIVDEGEINQAKTGGSARDFRASWRTYTKTAYDSTFTPARAMRH